MLVGGGPFWSGEVWTISFGPCVWSERWGSCFRLYGLQGRREYRVMAGWIQCSHQQERMLSHSRQHCLDGLKKLPEASKSHLKMSGGRIR